MGSEQIRPWLDDSNQQWETTRQQPGPPPAQASPPQGQQPLSYNQTIQEPVFREHGPTLPPQPQAPQFYPNNFANPASGYYNGPRANPPIPAQPVYTPGPSFPHQQVYPRGPQPYYGYQQPYGAYGQYIPYGYPYAPYYPWIPQPKRDGYQFGIALTSFICCILVISVGLLISFFIPFVNIAPGLAEDEITRNSLFSGIVLLTALAICGLVGGGSGLYHSIRAAFMKRPSNEFKIPSSLIFFGSYVVLIIVGFLISSPSFYEENRFLTIVMILLGGSLPALAFMAMATRRVRPDKTSSWPTTWRRLTIAMVSGGTLAIILAMVLESILTLWLGSALGIADILNSTDVDIPRDNGPLIVGMFILLAVIAPVVEELVKPLAVMIYVGRMRSAAESFVLGFAAGVGFDLIETSGYISSQGETQWLDIALIRSTGGLLHGFGSAMVALGWYYLIKKDSLPVHRIRIAIGCILYAVIQHAIWNGSFVFQLLPDPVGRYLETGIIMIGTYPFQVMLFIYIFWSVLMFAFFWFVLRKLREQTSASNNKTNTTQQPPQAPASTVAQPQSI